VLGNWYWDKAMRIIKGVLKEELANSLKMQKDYQRQLAKLPKGALVKKTIKGRAYYYLAFRQDGKVKSVYQGRISDKDIEHYRQAGEYRAKYRKLLSEVKQQIRFLQGTLRGKKSV
jgi:hypothetical protein